MPEKTKGDSLGFSNIHSVAKEQKKWRGTLWGKNFFRKKVSQCRKKMERGDPLARKNFRKKVSQCRKTERGFWTSILSSQNIKKLKGKKNCAEKNWKGGDPLGFSNIHSVAKQQQNWRGDPLVEKLFPKKSLAVPKKMERGDPLARKNFRKKVSQCRKTERGFWTSILSSQNIKKLKGKKICAEKNWKGGTLWDFPTSILSQNSNKIEGGTLWGKNFFRKSRSAEKNWKGGPFGIARYGMLRGKTGKTFLVQFARPNGSIWDDKIL